jgi:hypothetical protein
METTDPVTLLDSDELRTVLKVLRGHVDLLLELKDIWIDRNEPRNEKRDEQIASLQLEALLLNNAIDKLETKVQ